MGLEEELRKRDNSDLLQKVVGYLFPISQFYGNRKMVVCDWHPDTTPSAKIFTEDEDGIEKHYCFSCRRMRTSYHYLKQIAGKDPVKCLLDTYPEAAIRSAMDNLFDSVVVRTTEEEQKLLVERKVPFIESIDEFIIAAYKVE